jgi:hypothetical protein
MEQLKTVSTVKKLKFYTKRELAIMYETSPKTFTRWIKPHAELIGDKNGRYYTITQVKTIFQVLGLPSNIVEIE